MAFRIVIYLLLCLTFFASCQAVAQDKEDFGINQFTVGDMWIVSGVTDSKVFAASGQEGDWQGWDIDFGWFTDKKFLEMPIVLVSGCSDSWDTPAVVGQARVVTKEGFSLYARNSDTLSGYSARFAWVAIGKGPDPEPYTGYRGYD
jgi:hypothetical protein